MLRGEKIVFTGKLDTLSRKQAQALVTALGGKPQAAVTKDTTILVVGKANTNLFPRRSAKSEDAKSGSFAARRFYPFLEQVSAHLNQVVGMMNVTGK
jgi:BRCT domain type II-containing protein